jgi:hypothetical protein
MTSKLLRPPARLYLVKGGDSIMHEWTFSSTAEYVLGVLLVIAMVAVAFA